MRSRITIRPMSLSPASVTFAQTVELFGPVLPMIYDGQGGRHYCLYGYEGPFDPSIASQSDNIIVCRSGLSLPRLQDRQFSSLGTRDRAQAPK